MAIQLTEAAKGRMRDYLSRTSGAVGVRFGIKRTGCSGFGYVVDLADAIGDADSVLFDQDGIRLVVDRKWLPFVDGTEIEEVTDYKLMREFIDRVFKKYLTPRERKILYLYYGLEEGSEAMTLEKIGALMGVTRERIRQIRERAFEKLRESPDGKALCGFWAA